MKREVRESAIQFVLWFLGGFPIREDLRHDLLLVPTGGAALRLIIPQSVHPLRDGEERKAPILDRKSVV